MKITIAAIGCINAGQGRHCAVAVGSSIFADVDLINDHSLRHYRRNLLVIGQIQGIGLA